MEKIPWVFLYKKRQEDDRWNAGKNKQKTHRAKTLPNFEGYQYIYNAQV